MAKYKLINTAITVYFCILVAEFNLQINDNYLYIRFYVNYRL